MTGKNGNTLKYRVGEVEKDVDQIDRKVDLLLTNHLPHLKTQVAALGTQIKVLTVVNVGAIVMAYLLRVVFP